MSRTETLFLYGSLLQRTGNSQVDRIISRFTRPLYRGYMLGRLYDLGSYPGVVESGNTMEKVYGLLVELSRASFCLPIIDRFEDFREKQPQNSQYIRKQIAVHAIGNNRNCHAWTYIYNQPVKEEQFIRSGNWLTYRDKQRD